MARSRTMIIFDTCPFCGVHIRGPHDGRAGKPAGAEVVTTKRHTKNYFHTSCYQEHLRKQKEMGSL